MYQMCYFVYLHELAVAKEQVVIIRLFIVFYYNFT